MIRPLALNEDGSIEAIFDEFGHTGTVTAAQVTLTQTAEGLPPAPSLLALPCPDGCGAVSYHPRESSDPLIQELFTRKTAEMA